jgi:fatty-acyl-CoA synthase
VRPTLYIEDLVAVLAGAGERTVVRHEGRDVGGRALLDAVHRHARVLGDLGVGRGDLVAIYAADRPESLVVRYATHLLGAGSVYLSAPPDPAVRARMLVDLAPRVLVVEPGTAHLVPETDVPLAAVGGPVPGVGHRLDETAATASSDPVPPAARPGACHAKRVSDGRTKIDRCDHRGGREGHPRERVPARPRP